MEFVGRVMRRSTRPFWTDLVGVVLTEANLVEEANLMHTKLDGRT